MLINEQLSSSQAEEEKKAETVGQNIERSLS